MLHYSFASLKSAIEYSKNQSTHHIQSSMQQFIKKRLEHLNYRTILKCINFGAHGQKMSWFVYDNAFQPVCIAQWSELGAGAKNCKRSALAKKKFAHRVPNKLIHISFCNLFVFSMFFLFSSHFCPPLRVLG